MAIYISDNPKDLNAIYTNPGHPLVTLENPDSKDDAIWFHFHKDALELLIRFAQESVDSGDESLNVLFSGDIILRKDFTMSDIKGHQVVLPVCISSRLAGIMHVFLYKQTQALCLTSLRNSRNLPISL